MTAGACCYTDGRDGVCEALRQLVVEITDIETDADTGSLTPVNVMCQLCEYLSYWLFQFLVQGD